MNPDKQRRTNLIIGRGLRYLIFTGIMVGVSYETGFWTTLCLILIFVEGELKTHLFSKVAETVQRLTSITMRIIQKCQEDTDENNQEE